MIDMHQALYRIYRPKTFEDIVGQEHITSVLVHQIREQAINHAYLFCGLRGTGKTSTAKVLAKAVNCLGEHKPCYQCKPCLEGDLDEIELDAASNNSVDNIRDIRDNVVFMPSVGRYKVYIIDEVHMLSQGAFNALLKTLEEPPAHVIFILATTEPQKIPATVLSRCQRFDFKKLDEETVVRHLSWVLQQEDKPFEEEAIRIIAQKSDGGMRDALTLLDKAMSLDVISQEEVIRLLGEVPREENKRFLQLLKTKDTTKLLELIDKVSSDGMDMKLFVKGIITYIRDCIFNKYEVNGRTSVEGEEYETSQLISWLELLFEVQSEMRFSSFPAEMFEVMMVKYTSFAIASKKEGSSDYRQLLEELAYLREEVQRLKQSCIGTAVSLQREIVTADDQKEEKRNVQSFEKEISEEEKAKIESANRAMIQVYDLLRQHRAASTKALMQEGRVARRIGRKLYISYDKPFAFHKKKIDTQENRELIGRLFSQVLEENIEVHFLYCDQLGEILEEDVPAKRVLEELKKQFPNVPIEIKQ